MKTADRLIDWRWQLKNSSSPVPDPDAVPDVPADLRPRYDSLLARYPLRVTPYYAALATGDASDPVRMQYVPRLEELDAAGGDLPDPFYEERHTPVPGIVHRYRNRVVALVTDRCAVNCRHCTRKNTVRQLGYGMNPDRLRGMVEYIERTTAIREVIVSGGDPLVLETGQLDSLLGSLRCIRHVEVLRLGTRAPVVLPMRIDDELCDMLAAHRPLWVNTQFNHPAELTDESMAACEALIQRGIPVSNQCVLLKGVNDDFAAMRDLCNGLQVHLVRPYYVFLCDPVKGTAHLRTEKLVAIKLKEALQRELGGLAMPRFVQDVPDAQCKTEL